MLHLTGRLISIKYAAFCNRENIEKNSHIMKRGRGLLKVYSYLIGCVFNVYIVRMNIHLILTINFARCFFRS